MQQNIDGNITFSNNARSATRSYITSLCLEKFLDNTSDLVFVEFIANDGSEMDVSYTDNQKARFFERFLRNILKKPNAPAVVMMQVRTVTTAFVVHISWECLYFCLSIEVYKVSSKRVSSVVSCSVCCCVLLSASLQIANKHTGIKDSNNQQYDASAVICCNEALSCL